VMNTVCNGTGTAMALQRLHHLSSTSWSQSRCLAPPPFFHFLVAISTEEASNRLFDIVTVWLIGLRRVCHKVAIHGEATAATSLALLDLHPSLCSGFVMGCVRTIGPVILTEVERELFCAPWALHHVHLSTVRSHSRRACQPPTKKQKEISKKSKQTNFILIFDSLHFMLCNMNVHLHRPPATSTSRISFHIQIQNSFKLLNVIIINIIICYLSGWCVTPCPRSPN
jgi:hypothetical protein